MFLCLIVLTRQPTAAENTLYEVCPTTGIQERPTEFQPGGIILTQFDRANIWVYNVDNNRRYPLLDTFPCNGNCHLSRDARWITYFNDITNAYNKMRLDGTQRAMLVEDAGDVQWWTDNTLLVWTPGHDAYLRAEAGGDREWLNVDGVVSVQPGGRWGLLVEQDGDGFSRALVNLALRDIPTAAQQIIPLGSDAPYFNNSAWSPDGEWLAYVRQGAFDPQANITGGEIFGIRPADGVPVQWTDLTSLYGAVRINGLAVGDLSWSPDGTRLAFWVIKLLGPDPTGNLGTAVVHMLDITTGALRVYCGFATTEHTPSPPRIVWSPDGTHLAFGGNVPGDDKGYLLLAMDVETGVVTALSEGIYPALGSPIVIAWGLPPE